MRELSAGVYNLMKKSNRIHQMTASSLLSNVQSNDEHLESNLCTMLQSVRGTQQYWFVRKSELKCMIREYGSPTLFLTFSCAEYESADIAIYLRKINNVPASYNIGKLCTEDPISVSRKFSPFFIYRIEPKRPRSNSPLSCISGNYTCAQFLFRSVKWAKHG